MAHFPNEVDEVVERYSAIWVNEDAAEKAQLSPAERLAYHREHSLPVMEHLRSGCEVTGQKTAAENNSGLGPAIQYFLKHYEGLTAFCRIEGAKLDNNLAEQLLKLIARCRKNAQFYKTQAGADVGDVITSLLATCEQNGINGFDYLLSLQPYRLVMGQSPERWLPWNYQETLVALEADAITV